jgi:hypothetical protein
VCRFNPVYAHGMTAALKETVMVRDLLNSRQNDAYPLAGLTEAMMAAADPLLDNIWSLSAIPDLAYPETRGARPENLQETLDYQVALHRAALVDAEIHKLLMEVITLVKPASAILGDNVVERVERLASAIKVAGDPVPA